MQKQEPALLVNQNASNQIYLPHKLFGTLYTKKHKVILKVNTLFEDVFSVYI